MVCRIHHVIDELLHRRLLNALQVVADAHIENKGFGIIGAAGGEHFIQQMQDKPGFQILIPGFLKGKFCGPFGVKAFVFRIDTGFFQLEAIEDLYRFEFDETATGQPGGHNILGELGMRPGCRANGRGAGFAKDGNWLMLPALIELLLRNTKNSVVLVVFIKQTRQKFLKRDGTHDIPHNPLLIVAIYNRNGRRCVNSRRITLYEQQSHQLFIQGITIKQICEKPRKLARVCEISHRSQMRIKITLFIGFTGCLIRMIHFLKSTEKLSY